MGIYRLYPGYAILIVRKETVAFVQARRIPGHQRSKYSIPSASPSADTCYDSCTIQVAFFGVKIVSEPRE